MLSLLFTFFDMNTYSPIVILPTVPSDLHTEIAADVLDCSNRLGVGWPVCVCVRVYRENFPLTCLDISYIDTRSINASMHGNYTNMSNWR